MRIFCPAMVVGRPSLPAASVRGPGGGPRAGSPAARCSGPSAVSPAGGPPVHEVGRVALDLQTGPRVPAPRRAPVVRGPDAGRGAHGGNPARAAPYAQPLKDATLPP